MHSPEPRHATWAELPWNCLKNKGRKIRRIPAITDLFRSLVRNIEDVLFSNQTSSEVLTLYNVE